MEKKSNFRDFLLDNYAGGGIIYRLDSFAVPTLNCLYFKTSR